MNITNHARIRAQQRGFFNEDIELILTYGDAIKKPGNVTEYRISKKFIQRLDKIRKKAVLTDGEDVITVYNRR